MQKRLVSIAAGLVLGAGVWFAWHSTADIIPAECVLNTNEGATSEQEFTLPTAVTGVCRTYIVQDADGLRVTAAAGDTIRVGTSVSATAGYVHSFVPGASLTLTAINATEWVATEGRELWLVDGWQAEILGLPNLKRYRLVQDDFSGFFTTGAMQPFSPAVANSGTSGTSLTGIDGSDGNTYEVSTGSGTTGRARLAGELGFVFGSGVVVFDARVGLSHLSDASDPFTAWIGFNDSDTDSGVDALACRYSHTINDGEFECYARQDFGGSGGETSCDSNVVVAAAAWYQVSFVSLSASDVRIFINGSQVCSLTTNVPSGFARATWTKPLQIVKGGAGTNARKLYADYARYTVALTTPR